MTFRPRRPPELGEIVAGGAVIESVQSTTFLGITLNERLDIMKKHIIQLRRKLSRSRAILYHLNKCLPAERMGVVYNAYFLNHRR